MLEALSMANNAVTVAWSRNGLGILENAVKVKLYKLPSLLAPPLEIFDAVTLAPSKEPIN